MAIATLRRWEDDVLLSDVIYSYRPSSKINKAILNTITGVTQKQKIGVMQRFIDLTIEFDSEEPSRNIARFNVFMYDHHMDDIRAPIYFKYTHHDGAVYQLRLLEVSEPEMMEVTTSDVFTVDAAFKIAGFYS